MLLTPKEFYQGLEKELISCELCGSTKFERILDRDRYNMGLVTAMCLDCGFLFTNPRPRQDEMTRFYQTIYRKFYTGSTQPEKEYKEKLHILKRQWLIDLCAPELEPRAGQTPAILDAGCGAGAILHLARKRWPQSDLYGTEPYQVFADYAAAQSEGRVFAEHLDEFLATHPELKGHFDLVILNHVLEHLYQPVDKILALRDLIKEDGLLLIQVPNLLSPHWDKTLPIFHIAHISHFTNTTMRRLLALCGFEVLKEIPVSYPVHLKAMTYLAKKLPIIPKSVPLPPPQQVQTLKKAFTQISLKAMRPVKRNPFVRIWGSLTHRGPLYTIKRLAYFAGRIPDKIASLTPAAQAEAKKKDWTVFHMKNDPVLRDLICGEKVLILGSGPSASQLKSIPNDVKVLTCNACLRLFDSKKWNRKPDLFLTRKKAMLEDYTDSETLLNKYKPRILIVDVPDFVRKKMNLEGAYQKILADHQKENFYFEKLIAPQTVESLKAEHGIWGNVTWTSAGIRLLQYAIYFEAKEIYLAGIDIGEAAYFWGGQFINKHPMDIKFVEIASQRFPFIYSAVESSPITKHFPFRPLGSESIAGTEIIS